MQRAEGRSTINEFPVGQKPASPFGFRRRVALVRLSYTANDAHAAFDEKVTWVIDAEERVV